MLPCVSAIWELYKNFFKQNIQIISFAKLDVLDIKSQSQVHEKDHRKLNISHSKLSTAPTEKENLKILNCHCILIFLSFKSSRIILLLKLNPHMSISSTNGFQASDNYTKILSNRTTLKWLRSAKMDVCQKMPSPKVKSMKRTAESKT